MMRSIAVLGESPVVSVVQACRNRLREYYRDRLKSVVLYGSAARQEMTAESDIDNGKLREI